MFVFDFVVSAALEEIMDWLYGNIVEVLSALFGYMNGMGSDVLDMPWVEGIVLFFSKLGWALYVVGLVVSVFECGLDYSQGKGSMRDSLINMLKGFMAVSLFTVVPVRLYQLSVNLALMLGSALTDISIDEGFSMTLRNWLHTMSGSDLFISPSPSSALFNTCFILLGAYAIFKVFFGNLKRGGILVIQMAVGSLYMFSVPRGYKDGFIQWMKQVIALCLTTFLQSIMLTAGLMVFREKPMLGLGKMLASAEVPRICGQFGMDTSTKVNVMSSVYAAQTAVNLSKNLFRAAATK